MLSLIIPIRPRIGRRYGDAGGEQTLQQELPFVRREIGLRRHMRLPVLPEKRMSEEHDSFASRLPEPESHGRPLPSPPLKPYIPRAAREGGYGDKWASE
jgi:hypothetical protein